MTGRWRTVRNVSTGAVVLAKARMCDTFWCRFRGLQLVRRLPEDEGLLFVLGAESRAAATIHMLFMLFSIGVVWLDASGKVVDACLAKPWRLAYAPRQAAQYFIEANPTILERIQVGDVLSFSEPAS